MKGSKTEDGAVHPFMADFIMSGQAVFVQADQLDPPCPSLLILAMKCD